MNIWDDLQLYKFCQERRLIYRVILICLIFGTAAKKFNQISLYWYRKQDLKYELFVNWTSEMIWNFLDFAKNICRYIVLTWFASYLAEVKIILAESTKHIIINTKIKALKYSVLINWTSTMISSFLNFAKNESHYIVLLYLRDIWKCYKKNQPNVLILKAKAKNKNCLLIGLPHWFETF